MYFGENVDASEELLNNFDPNSSSILQEQVSFFITLWKLTSLKLSHYLDVVEVELMKQIGARRESFFAAVSK
jgi:hypothetical protein